MKSEHSAADAGAQVAWPSTCDGIEQEAFVAWAESRRMDMTMHPLYRLFLNSETDAARNGWKSGLTHAVKRMQAAPQAIGGLVAGERSRDSLISEILHLRAVLTPTKASQDAWCQPMDCGKHTPRVWLIRFEDQDVGDLTFGQ